MTARSAVGLVLGTLVTATLLELVRHEAFDVGRLTGRRTSVVDPWRLLPDLVKRLRGKPLPPSGDLYVLPVDVFRSAREESRR